MLIDAVNDVERHHHMNFMVGGAGWGGEWALVSAVRPKLEKEPGNGCICHVFSMDFGIPASIQAKVPCSIADLVEVLEERKPPSFPCLKQSQLRVFRAEWLLWDIWLGLCMLLRKIPDEPNTQNQYWATTELWLRKAGVRHFIQSATLSDYFFIYCTSHRQRRFSVYLTHRYPDEKFRVIMGWEPPTLQTLQLK